MPIGLVCGRADGVAVENHQLLSDRASWAGAREIQVALLPQRRPAIDGYEFWETYLPTHEVGGDLYDLVVGPTEARSWAGKA